MLTRQVATGEAKVEIAYKRSVTPQGNRTAISIMEQVFQPAPASWRGVGEVADSGLSLKPEFKNFDAEHNFDFEPEPTKTKQGCICGDILRGVKTPQECKLFKKVCTPVRPVGPCMVSSEGSCAAYYHYGGDDVG